MLQHNEFEKIPFEREEIAKKSLCRVTFLGKCHFAEGKNCEKVPLGRENDAAMTIL